MAGTQILSEVIADQRAWTAQTIDTGESWRYALTPDCFAELDDFLAQRQSQSQPITETRVESADFPACAAVLEGALDARWKEDEVSPSSSGCRSSVTRVTKRRWSTG